MSKVAPHFDAILALVAGGMPIVTALTSRPEFPQREQWKAYAYYKGAPERRARAEAAKAAGKAIRDARGFTLQHYTEEQYERSLQIISDNFGTRMIKLKYAGGPGHTMLYMRSKRDAEFAERFKRAKTGRHRAVRERTYSDDDYDRAVALIKQIGVGAYRDREPEGLPHHSVVWRRSHTDAAFGRRYAAATAVSQIPQRGEKRRSALLSNDLYAQVNRAVSKTLDPDAREDVISDIVEAVLSGRVAEADIAAKCTEFVTAHNRLFSKYRNRSIDAPIIDGRALNILDRLTTDSVASWCQ
jgi:hypothetical protein